MKDLKDEVIEEYFGGPEGKNPEDIIHEEAIMLIGLVYKFVKTQDYLERNLGMMCHLKSLLREMQNVREPNGKKFILTGLDDESVTLAPMKKILEKNYITE